MQSVKINSQLRIASYRQTLSLRVYSYIWYIYTKVLKEYIQGVGYRGVGYQGRIQRVYCAQKSPIRYSIYVSPLFEQLSSNFVRNSVIILDTATSYFQFVFIRVIIFHLRTRSLLCCRNLVSSWFCLHNLTLVNNQSASVKWQFQLMSQGILYRNEFISFCFIDQFISFSFLQIIILEMPPKGRKNLDLRKGRPSSLNSKKRKVYLFLIFMIKTINYRNSAL